MHPLCLCYFSYCNRERQTQRAEGFAVVMALLDVSLKRRELRSLFAILLYAVFTVHSPHQHHKPVRENTSSKRYIVAITVFIWYLCGRQNPKMWLREWASATASPTMWAPNAEL